MPNYQCPSCHGGFEEPEEITQEYGDKVDGCPWCHQEFGSFEVVDPSEQMQEMFDSLDDVMPGGDIDSDDFRIGNDDDDDDNPFKLS